ncbi:MAG: D-alanyl-D-alanine carboxypeptidase/D-alanyl-D-alanine-endopeptidase [Burkholderiales bacterium]|nr:D-alanyl-D-alanine carboxypeptidase/D-alanyl-D-alanine-endopeptidase [Burkholderiales bacterium]
MSSCRFPRLAEAFRSARRALCLTLAASLVAAAGAARAGGPLPWHEWLAAGRLGQDQVGAIVLPLDGGPPLFAHEAQRPLNPASTMKLLTTYAALSLLGPDYRWRTELRLRGPLQDGVLRGDLILRGGGDPKLVIEDLAELMAHMRAAGLQRIDGDLVIDDSIYGGDVTGAAFDGDPSQPYNVRPFGALMNFKSTKLVVRPNGRMAEVSFDPALDDIPVDNQIKLVGGPCRHGVANLMVRDGAQAGAPTVRVAGSYSRACGEQSMFAAVLDHRQFVHALFKAAWRAAGGQWQGRTRIERNVSQGAPWLVWESPRTLADVIYDINKFSNNVMARHVMLQLAAEAGMRPAVEADAARIVWAWLAAQRLRFDELVVDNGSGLSREERTSAEHLARVLRHAATGPYADLLRDSLPVVGVDGTMRKRLLGEPIVGRAWVKTGSLNNVRAIAGYVDAASGKRYALALIVNGPGAAESRPLQDSLLRWVYENG